MPKAVAAQRRLGQINSEVRRGSPCGRRRSPRTSKVWWRVRLHLDATDNLETRFLINDAAIKHRIPWVYGAAVGSYGVSMTVLPKRLLACVCPRNTALAGEFTDLRHCWS